MKLKHFVTIGRFPGCKIVNINQFSLLSLGKDYKNIFNSGNTDFQQLKKCFLYRKLAFYTRHTKMA